MREINTKIGTNSANNMPEKKFSAGAIKATVWKNQTVKPTGDPSEYVTISIERVYKDKEGKWQSTNSLRVNDLPKAAVVINKAYEHVVLSHTPTSVDDLY